MKKFVVAMIGLLMASPTSAIDVVKSGVTYVVTPSAAQIAYWEEYGGSAAVKAELEDWDGKVQRAIDEANKASLNDQCAGLSDAEKAQIDALLTGSPCASAVDSAE